MPTYFDPATCGLFLDECGKNFSTEEIIRFVIGMDDNGCPYVKTNGPTAAQIVDLTAAITALTAAINAM